MKALKKLIKLTCWLVICFLFLFSAEGKAQVKKMSAKDLTEESTAVLYGKCKKIKSEWNEDKSIIMTYVTIEPEEYIKGNLGEEAVIAVPGGRVDDIIYEVSEMPLFIEGEEVMVFIWTNPAGKNLVTGGYKGKMKIEKDSRTGKRMVETDEVTEENVEIENLVPGQAKKAERMQLEDFVGKLKGYMKH